jgi:ABC-type lipoprotein release transport system permease subunit
MNALTLVLRGLRFYRRTHLGVAAGAAVSSAVLVGALFVGDSVRGSLERLALARLGRVHHAVDAGERFFRDDLPARLGLRAAAALRVRGMALLPSRRANRVEVYGVAPDFWRFAESPEDPKLGPDDVAVSARLAGALGLKVGDEVSLRLFMPGLLTRDAPLAKQEDRETQRDRFTVRAVLSDDRLGRFSLRSDQAAPLLAFVERAALQRRVELEGRANLLVAGEGDAAAALRKAWTLEDAGLELRTAGDVLQLESPRIYLDPAVAEAALALRPEAVGSLAYLVNSISAADGKSTPYSFMVGLSPGRGAVPEGMKDDEILVHPWLAEHLAVRPGDALAVAYYEMTPSNDYVERTRSFRVRGVVGKAALAAERELVPKFPGLTDVDRCRDWKIGIPLDEEKLKDKANEEYWEQHRQTPKAFVTLAAARAMWGNRWGDLMSVRYPASTAPGEVRGALRARVDPAATGLQLRPAREQALRAARESMDLGQLFLGMSVFLIAASLVLTAMLFTFSAEQRARETGVLLAAGLRPGRVRALLVLEGALVAVAGSLAGVPLGWAFARALLGGLASFWSGAVADASLAFHATVSSAATGAVAGAVLSTGALAQAVWRHARRPVRELVAEDFTLSLEKRAAGKGRLRWIALAIGLLGAAGAAAGTVASGTPNAAPAFFGAGALALVGGIALVRIALARLDSGRFTAASLGRRNAARRPGRSMAAAGMLASGAFIVVAVAAMKEDLALSAGDRASGTGGFELYGESSVPVRVDLNGAKGRETYRLPEGVSFVQLKSREGDDASCLNLNMALAPSLVGVDPERLADLGAFLPAETWRLLDAAPSDGSVPALVGDSATALWKLKKKVGPDGDTLDYLDERGNAVKVRLVGALPVRLSVLQGRLLVANRHFTRLYPSEGGTRIFLVDAPAGKEAETAALLSGKLGDVGLDVAPSVDRLKGFYVVETTYLMMFLVLGGLGLLLGSAGMAVLVLRNVLERRSELAILRAVGFTEARVADVVVAEHRFLVWAGLAAGAGASLLAVVPAAARPGVDVPFALLGGFLAGTFLLSLGWIRLAARLALRAPLVSALRNE